MKPNFLFFKAWFKKVIFQVEVIPNISEYQKERNTIKVKGRPVPVKI